MSGRLVAPSAGELDRDPAEPRPLSGRGLELWDELSPRLGPVHRVLLMEACRLVERGDRLDGLIAGRARRGEWLRLQTGDDGELRVVVDDLLAEARQHASALRMMLADLAKALPDAPSTSSEGGGVLADLTAAIAARRGAAAR